MDESFDRGPMWLCRSRNHQWPLREHAEMCCHTHQVEVHYGHGPNRYPGPEAVLPFNGMDEPPSVAHCWILVEADRVAKPLELVPSPYTDPSALSQYERDRLGPWRPEIYADREVVSTEAYEQAIARAHRSLRRRPHEHEVEAFISRAET